MGDIPKLNSNSGVANPDASRLEDQPIPGRTGQPNTNANTRDAPPPRMEAADRTRPADPVKLAMTYFRNPKSPVDEVKGKIPTPKQINYLVAEFGPADTSPPKAHRYTYNRATQEMEPVAIARSELEIEPIEILHALFCENMANLDQATLVEIMEDRPLLLQLQNFLAATNGQGKVEFVDTIPQGAQVEGEYIGLNEYHLDAEERQEEDINLHQALRDALHMTPNRVTDAASQQQIRAERILGKIIDKDDLTHIDQEVLEDIKKDRELLLKLEGFLARTQNRGDIVFRDIEAPEVSYSSSTISLPEYHLDEGSRLLENENLHDALRAGFNMSPLERPTVAPENLPEWMNVSEEALQELDAILDGTNQDAPADPNVRPADGAAIARPSSQFDRLPPAEKLTAVRDFWTLEQLENPQPVSPERSNRIDDTDAN